MANTQYNYASLTQSVANNIMQTAINKTQRECTNIDEYNNFIIEGVTIKGDLRFAQVCEISGDDIINNSLESLADSMLNALQKQKQMNDTFFLQLTANTNVNKAIIKQEVINNLVQTAINSCQQTVTNVRRGTSIAVRNSTIEGSTEFIQKGNISTDCFITNLAKAAAFNQLRAEQDQVQATSVGFGNILLIVAAVAAVLVIGVVIYFVFTSKGKEQQSAVKIIDTRSKPVQ